MDHEFTHGTWVPDKCKFQKVLTFLQYFRSSVRSGQCDDLAHQPSVERTEVQTFRYFSIHINTFKMPDKTHWNWSKKSRIRETLNLLTCADSSTDTTKNLLQVSHVTSHVSGVTCHLSHVTNANSHTHDPPPANSSSMHSRMLLLILT